MKPTNSIFPQLMPSIICRTPAFSPYDQLEEHWPALKEMIREASPAFFVIIENLSYGELNQASKKIQHTVWKYFNRARYRATPFGRFAAISILPVLPAALAGPVILPRKPTVRKLVDWSEKDILPAKNIAGRDVFFRSNATWYQVGSEVRYIRQEDGRFELAVTEGIPELLALLTLCLIRTNMETIRRHIGRQFNLDDVSIDQLLQQSLACQLLLSEEHPNITGKDYFQRLGISGQGISTYDLAIRKPRSGCLDSEAFRHIPGYLHFIKAFLPERPNAYIETFRREFLKKFARKAIPLAIAMDPETGIGYGDMAQSLQNPEWSSRPAYPENSGQSFRYTPQHRFLLNSLLKGGTINLEAFENDGITHASSLPNTLSVVCHDWNGNIVIENTGGCTASALIGRFSHGDRQAEQIGKSIASAESSANPGILFFDIAYQAEAKIDNINRRKNLYPAELPILNWSCHPVSLAMEDILIAIRGGEIVLWSKKHRQRLVPRIASAYNYTRSDLAIYRFLCDLQHQGLRTDLSFSLQQFFPGLDYYPRVIYKDLIVSPAMWRIDPGIKTVEQLRSWLSRQQVDCLFKCGKGDQTLCFDPGIPEDLAAFLHYMQQNTIHDSYISEALCEPSSIMRDERGESYAAQYILNYLHKQVLYKPHPLTPATPGSEAHFPGGEWLYFEIYTHTGRSDELLTRFIGPYLSRHKKKLRKWFFIRYSDPAPHIRLRMQLREPAAVADLIASLRECLGPMCAAGLVADIQLKTYQPETERYGAKRISKAEIFFFQDSKYILRQLRQEQGGSNSRLYLLAIAQCSQLCTWVFDDGPEKLLFIQTMADSFASEQGFSVADYKRINHDFEKLKSETRPATLSVAYSRAFCKLIRSCNPGQEKAALLADLIHMHINRLFSNSQRLHEAIIYQYLLKVVKREHFFAKAQAAPVAIP